jgi:hypothetical protein
MATRICKNCSSLGLDTSVGNPPARSVDQCDSCGGPWPLDPALRFRMLMQQKTIEAEAERILTEWKAKNP